MDKRSFGCGCLAGGVATLGFILNQGDSVAATASDEAIGALIRLQEDRTGTNH